MSFEFLKTDAGEGIGVIRALFGSGYGEVFYQLFAHANRSAPGPPASVGGGEGFVQIELHGVDAEIAGSGLAHNGIHVGTVAEDEAALVVDNVRHLFDVFFEQSQGIGIG